MQCTPADPSEGQGYGYVKEHCDYQPKEECQTVTIEKFSLQNLERLI